MIMIGIHTCLGQW